ncbi:MAG: enoyl-CoA hydratase-related protein [Chloroflexaceae bacterium]|jgi:methylglutaconyl-CoA hydratase|nr:enoyl-CoA hydratase-related protein [Chloroflexaceae bacterium]
MYKLLTLTYDGPVATLTLNRPEVHNAFNVQLIAELHAACEELARDASLRVVVLNGAGPSFCAGADINWMRESLAYSHEENLADAGRLDAMLDALDSLPLAVVASVHGAALGGGVGLLSCCDVVIAAEGTKFGFTEVRLGLLPAVIARYVVPKIGASQARALFVTGQRFDTARALAIGLVHGVVPAAELEASVSRTVAELLRCGPQAIAASKALVRAVCTLPHDEARQYVIEAIAAARTGPEGQEGLKAFLEKRAPGWGEGN